MKNDLKYKLYQMFLLGLEGKTLETNQNLINALKNNLGGVIFFTQNIHSENQFKKLIEDIEKKSETKPFLSIDQEGGRVERTENIFGSKKYLSAKFAAEKGEAFLKTQTETIAKELKSFGINLNFAPCIDVNTNPKNPIIGERAFSSDTDSVIKFGKIAAKTYLDNGIIPCIKHFPGHGDAEVDSHIELPKIDLSLEEMKKFHIKPFRKVDAPMLMVAHMHCKCFDREETPSSLSKNVLDFLKNDIKYRGIIISDDMIMGAVKKLGKKGCIMGIKAGLNMFIYRDSSDETINLIEEIYEEAKKDSELQTKIEESYEKIKRIKQKFLTD